MGRHLEIPNGRHDEIYMESCSMLRAPQKMKACKNITVYDAIHSFVNISYNGGLFGFRLAAIPKLKMAARRHISSHILCKHFQKANSSLMEYSCLWVNQFSEWLPGNCKRSLKYGCHGEILLKALHGKNLWLRNHFIMISKTNGHQKYILKTVSEWLMPSLTLHRYRS